MDMSAINLSTAEGQRLTQWDIGLSKTTAGVIRARLSLYGDGLLCDLLQELRNLRRYIALGSASRREASSTLESLLATVVSPLLQEFSAQQDAFDVLKEILDIIGAHKCRLFLFCHCLFRLDRWNAVEDFLTAVLLGRGDDEIMAMMGEQGIFHILTTMLMYAPTTEPTSACLGRLAGTSDSAAREAQVPLSITLVNGTSVSIVSCSNLHTSMQQHVHMSKIIVRMFCLGHKSAAFPLTFSAVIVHHSKCS